MYGQWLYILNQKVYKLRYGISHICFKEIYIEKTKRKQQLRRAENLHRIGEIDVYKLLALSIK